MSHLDQQLNLPDGRCLGYDDFGPPDGVPVFYFHGTPSSRLECRIFGVELLAHKLHLRVIAPDRPGMGLSSYLPGRCIADWPADVTALAGHLGLERFAVLGYSGGGPYAVVCALAIPGRLTRVGVVSGAGDFSRPGLLQGIPAANLRYFAMAREKPLLSRLSLGMMGFMVKVAGRKTIENVLASLPASDRQVLSRPEMQAGFLSMLRESLRQGSRGAQHDTRLMISPWGFCPQEIRIHVEFWHGESDCNVPPVMGRSLADEIPDSHFRLHPGEGHISLIVRQIEGILRYLVE